MILKLNLYSSSDLAAPLPRPGFHTILEIDETVSLVPKEVFRAAILLMSYLSSQMGWTDIVEYPISIAEPNFKTECKLENVRGGQNPLSIEIAVQGLYQTGVAIAKKGAFYKLSSDILLGDDLYGAIKFFPKKPEDQSSVSLHVGPLEANSTEATVVSPRGRILDPLDNRFQITYFFPGLKIKAQDVFTCFLNAMAIAAEHDNKDLNAFVPAAPSGSGDVVLSTWTLVGKENPNMSWNRLKRAFFLIWQIMIINGVYTGRSRFEEFEFGLEYRGVEIGGGRLLKIDAASDDTLRTTRRKIT